MLMFCQHASTSITGLFLPPESVPTGECAHVSFKVQWWASLRRHCCCCPGWNPGSPAEVWAPPQAGPGEAVETRDPHVLDIWTSLVETWCPSWTLRSQHQVNGLCCGDFLTVTDHHSCYFHKWAGCCFEQSFEALVQVRLRKAYFALLTAGFLLPCVDLSWIDVLALFSDVWLCVHRPAVRDCWSSPPLEPGSFHWSCLARGSVEGI